MVVPEHQRSACQLDAASSPFGVTGSVTSGQVDYEAQALKKVSMRPLA